MVHNGGVRMKTISKLKKLPITGARRQEQAHFIWITLSSWVLFKKRQTITYGELAELLGYTRQAGRTLTEALGAVSLYCLYNDLPPLSCIVVAKNTHSPGWEGMILDDSDLKSEQGKVWNTPWHLYRTPSVGTFRNVRDQLNWGDFI